MSFKIGDIEFEVLSSGTRILELLKQPMEWRSIFSETDNFIIDNSRHLLEEAEKPNLLGDYSYWINVIWQFIYKDLEKNPFVPGEDTKREFWVGVSNSELLIGTWDKHPFSGINLLEHFPGGAYVITMESVSFNTELLAYTSQAKLIDFSTDAHKGTYFEVGKCYYSKSSVVPELFYCVNKDEQHLLIKFAYIVHDPETGQNEVCIVSTSYVVEDYDEVASLFRQREQNQQVTLSSSVCLDWEADNYVTKLNMLNTFSK